jgi:hypothetical protein
MSYLKIFFVLVCIFLFTHVSTYADGQPVINEFVAHPSSGNKEWVELYVPNGMDVTGYWIDDDTDFANDSGSSTKKQITSVIQGSDSQHVVYELSSSMFNNDGDTVALFSSDGTLVDHYSYANDPGVDISIGRTPDATGDFQILASVTQGSANSSPKPTDTPTPAPTDKPTKAPKPTETPIPTKTKTTSVTVPTSTSSKSVLADEISNPIIQTTSSSTKKVGSDDARPTSILGMSTKTPIKKVLPTPKKRILVEGISSSIPQLIAVSIGGLMLISCGILMYFKKKGMWFFRRD